jgi:hypothetical protein
MRMAPAAFSLATTVASVSGTRPLKIGEPRCVSTPAVSIPSLTVNGTPWRGPSRASDLTAASAFLAASSAPSAIVTMAFTLGLASAIRSRWAFMTSTGDSSRLATSSAMRLASI